MTALKFRDFSNLATGLVQRRQADLVRNLEPGAHAGIARADAGPKLGHRLAYFLDLPVHQASPTGRSRGDYMNQFIIFDSPPSRGSSTLAPQGTTWGDGERLKLVPGTG